VLGEYEAAAGEFHKGLELAREIGDPTVETNMLLGLSLTYNLYHRGEEALSYTERALAIARELNDPVLQAAGLANRLMARSAGYGQVVEATPDAEEALGLSREVGDAGLSAQTLIFCGQMFAFRADLERALGHLRQGLELAQRTHQGFFVGYAAFCLGHTYLAKGEYEEALRWYRHMSDYASAAGDKFWMARAPNIIGGVHLELYDLDEAIAFNLEGDEVSQKLIPWPEPRGHSLLKVGLAHLARGDHGLAAESSRSSVPWDPAPRPLRSHPVELHLRSLAPHEETCAVPCSTSVAFRHHLPHVSLIALTSPATVRDYCRGPRPENDPVWESDTPMRRGCSTSPVVARAPSRTTTEIEGMSAVRRLMPYPPLPGPSGSFPGAWESRPVWCRSRHNRPREPFRGPRPWRGRRAR
jgi:tetratricopeptide (TPR) repeat protein